MTTGDKKPLLKSETTAGKIAEGTALAALITVYGAYRAGVEGWKLGEKGIAKVSEALGNSWDEATGKKMMDLVLKMLDENNKRAEVLAGAVLAQQDMIEILQERIRRLEEGE